MPKNIRVYELAKELGLTNKEALDLSVSLGIGVRSHSSSIEDAQADRVRRKAEREGLVRAVQPEEPEAAPKAPARQSAKARAAAPVPAPTDLERPASERPEDVVGDVADATPRPPEGLLPEHRVVRSRPASELTEQTRAQLAERTPGPSPARPVVTTPRPAPMPAPPVAPRVSAPPTRPSAPAPVAESAAPAAADAPTPLLSPTGKPIPPPPGGPLRSSSGRPIPPPPGLGGRGPMPRGRPAAPGAGAPRPGGFTPRPGQPVGGARPGGFAGGGQSRPGGFAGRPAGGGGGIPGRPGGAPGAPGAGAPPGGRGGPRRPPQRRSSRRRRNTEELEPIQVSVYMPSSAPVPDSEVIIERGSTPQELGPKLNRSAGDVIRFLFLQGEVVTATQSLTDDMIELFAAELGANVRLVDPGEEQEAALHARYFAEDEEVDPELLRPRPPIITVMGHVDHGKTLLLDKIREANVVAGEAGGITQHIGAYQVERDGQRLTFIDTPGHEAFTAMRARGAQVTDIVVLVVAADDGVMPQTVEAINHAKAAEVPIVVALNKVDRAEADPNRVMQQLSEHGLVPEPWGGDTITVEVSALQGLGIDDLLDQLTVLAEVLELKANPEGPARGTVLEANLDIGRGPVATVVVQSGTLRVGDTIVAGAAWGKVKALLDDEGDQVKEALPSMPVQILGLSDPPAAGDELRATPGLAIARTIAEAREQRARTTGYAQGPVHGARLEDIFEQIQQGGTATLTVVLKADVQGSLEAVTESLRKLEREDVKVAFVDRGIGGITENNIQLATASNATVIGFNVRPDRRARELAEQLHVEIRTYEIIYKLIEDIEAAMVGMLAPVFEEVVTGDAEVREIFRVPRIGAIAGCYVQSGTITRGSKVRFIRDGVVIWKGAISSLRRFKDDAREVQAGFECGIGLTDFQDLHAGDIIETYEEREIPRT